MRVSTQIIGNPLSLDDVRRLVKETRRWSGSCPVEVIQGGALSDRVTVIERDSDRQTQGE